MSAADETAGTDTTTDAAAAAGSTAPEESDDGDRPVDRRETTAFLVANVGADASRPRRSRWCAPGRRHARAT